MRNICLRLIALFLFLSPNILFSQDPSGFIKASKFKSENPLEVLPKGHLAYAQISNFEKLVLDLDQLVNSFLPKEIVKASTPPAIHALLEAPQPVISLLSMSSLGNPMNAAQVLQMFGLDPSGGASFAFYPPKEGGKASFVLSIKTSNILATQGILKNLLFPKESIVIEEGEQKILHIQPMKSDLPKNLYITCSVKTIYISNSLDLAKAIFLTNAEDSLSADLGLKKVLKKNEKNDFFICLNADFVQENINKLKPMAGMVPMMAVSKLKQALLELPQSSRQNIELRLRFQFGFEGGLDGIIEYIDASLIGAWPILVNEFDMLINNFENLVISGDLEGEFQNLSMQIFSKDISASSRPLDKKELSDLMDSVPGDHTSVSISTKADPVEPGSFCLTLVDAIEKEIMKKKLDVGFVQKLKTYLSQTSNHKNIYDLAEISLKTIIASSEIKSPKTFKTTYEFFKYLSESAYKGSQFQVVELLKGLSSDEILSVFEQNAKDFQKSKDLSDAVFGDSVINHKSFCEKEKRVLHKDMPEGIREICLETAYKTTNGFFGYNEHELINREFLFLKEEGPVTFIQRGRLNSTYLGSMKNNVKATPFPESHKKLLAQVPEAGLTSIHLGRYLYMLPDFLVLVQDFESLVLNEFSDYLKSVKEAQNSSSAEHVLNKILAIEMPLFSSSLHTDEKGEPYLKFFGLLTYPRPNILPSVVEVFKDYAEMKNKVGGSLVYTTKEKGLYSCNMLVSSSGLAGLIRTVANNFFQTYASSPSAKQKLMSLLLVKGDGQKEHNKALVVNQLWDAFLKDK